MIARTRLSQTLQHFERDSSTSSVLDIEAWVRRVSSFIEPAARPKPHPARPRQKHFDTLDEQLNEKEDR